MYIISDISINKKSHRSKETKRDKRETEREAASSNWVLMINICKIYFPLAFFFLFLLLLCISIGLYTNKGDIRGKNSFLLFFLYKYHGNQQNQQEKRQYFSSSYIHYLGLYRYYHKLEIGHKRTRFNWINNAPSFWLPASKLNFAVLVSKGSSLFWLYGRFCTQLFEWGKRIKKYE